MQQCNAIRSWKRLHRDVQVILVGDEEGVAETSKELGTEHVPECERSEFGTPLVSSIFSIGRKSALSEIVCYCNADIILTSSFLDCLNVARRKKDRFLLIGRRWDVDLNTRLNFQSQQWESDLESHARSNGKIASIWQIDYFAFSRAQYATVPPFALGRMKWDNWLIWNATANRIPVIDASAFITAIHQNHDYNHHPQGEQGVWKGPESIRNHELAGGWPHIYSIADASHRIRSFGGRPLPYLFPCIVSRITSRVMRSPAYVVCERATKLILQGKWGLAWAKLVKKLNAWRDRTGI